MPLPVAHGLLGASVIAIVHPLPTKRYFVPPAAASDVAKAADFDVRRNPTSPCSGLFARDVFIIQGCVG